MERSKYTFHVEIIAQSKLAIFINDGITMTWLPKSQVESEWLDEIEKVINDNILIEITIPEWLAKEKELI